MPDGASRLSRPTVQADVKRSAGDIAFIQLFLPSCKRKHYFLNKILFLSVNTFTSGIRSIITAVLVFTGEITPVNIIFKDGKMDISLANLIELLCC